MQASILCNKKGAALRQPPNKRNENVAKIIKKLNINYFYYILDEGTN